MRMKEQFLRENKRFFVKSMGILKKKKPLFIFSSSSRKNTCYPHCLSVVKMKNLLLPKNKFISSNQLFNNFLSKSIAFTKFLPKNMRANIHIPHCSALWSWKYKRNCSHWKYISSNQLCRNLRKNVDFTKFLQ